MLDRILKNSKVARLEEELEAANNQIVGLQQMLDLKESELERLRDSIRGGCE